MKMEGSFKTNNGFEAETNLSTKIDISKSQSFQDNVLGENERITFSWSQLTVTVPEKSTGCCGRGDKQGPKTILNKASGIVRPGEFLAIMGASGAGKSTLLNTLLFRNLAGLKVSGVRLANNKVMSPTSLTSVSAYVQQDDLFIGTLTVREHLVFQALVRMDSNIPKKMRYQKVDEIIQEFGLSKCSDTVIGKPDQGVKGISGGQRKRLSLASEVLTNPAVMFCDEPTSGLDSFMASSVVETLRKLASQGRTVICTIHQPSSQITNLFDKVLLMAEGRTAFLGDLTDANPFLEKCGFPCPVNYNPADHWVQALAVIPGIEEKCRTNIERVCSTFNNSEGGKALEDVTSATSGDDQMMSDIPKSPYKASWFSQFNALMWRGFLSVIKEPLIVKVRIAQTIVIALILGLVYFGQERTIAGVQSINGALFLIVTNTTFSNMFAVINVITMELPIFMREHFNGMYRTDVYFITKQLAELPVFVITPMVFVGIIYFMVPLNEDVGRFFINLGITELLTQTVVSFGYLISCASSSVNMALAIGPTILIPLMLFGGLFLNNSTIPVYLDWVKYVSWFRYGFEALLINQWKGIDDIQSCQQAPSMENEICVNITGEIVVEDQLGFNMDNFGFDLGMLAALAIGFRIMALLLLLLKTYRRSN